MSRDASVTLTWGDGDYVFKLAIGEMRELQEKCDAGPMEIFRRLEAGAWRVDDIIQPLRLGLIGGGTNPIKALNLTRVYVEQRPLLENILFAQAVLWAGIAGVPEEDAGQKKSEGTVSPTHSPEESSASPSSTASAAQ